MGKFEQDIFDKIKQILSTNTLLTYPDFNETLKFIICFNKFQLRSVITWKGKTMYFYIRKLTEYQQR